MWNKTLIIAITLFIVLNQGLYAALPLKYTCAVATKTSSENIKANYELQKMKLYYGSGFANNAANNLNSNYSFKCLTSQAGRAMIVCGGIILVVGGIYAGSKKDDYTSGPVTERSRTMAQVGLIAMGFIVVGVFLAIVGGIYNRFNRGRYSAIAPKPNEVGISYTFK